MKPQSMFPSKSEIKLFHGDCLEVMQGMPDSSVDCVVTDPPAGISFMGKSWDGDKGGRDAWIEWMCGVATECLRVMKPGAHATVWALPRTSHWTATAWENAGFEVRDVVHHAFGSGFPKSMAIGKAIDKLQGNERVFVSSNPANRPYCYKKGETSTGWKSPPRPDKDKGDSEWEGYGTALKPAIENWILLRKPIEKGLTIAANCLKYGTGGLAIDRCRVETEESTERPAGLTALGQGSGWNKHENKKMVTGGTQGRFPANLILDDSEEVRSCFPDTGKSQGGGGIKNHIGLPCGEKRKGHDYGEKTGFGDSGSAARFFQCCPFSEDEKRLIYQAKPSRAERGAGNTHPTLKGIALMTYLCRLILPPDGGVVMDLFMGSGTTGIACKNLGADFIGIEKEKEYFEIAVNRIG